MEQHAAELRGLAAEAERRAEEQAAAAAVMAERAAALSLAEAEAEVLRAQLAAATEARAKRWEGLGCLLWVGRHGGVARRQRRPSLFMSNASSPCHLLTDPSNPARLPPPRSVCSPKSSAVTAARLASVEVQMVAWQKQTDALLSTNSALQAECEQLRAKVSEEGHYAEAGKQGSADVGNVKVCVRSLVLPWSRIPFYPALCHFPRPPSPNHNRWATSKSADRTPQLPWPLCGSASSACALTRRSYRTQRSSWQHSWRSGRRRCRRWHGAMASLGGVGGMRRWCVWVVVVVVCVGGCLRILACLLSRHASPSCRQQHPISLPNSFPNPLSRSLEVDNRRSADIGLQEHLARFKSAVAEVTEMRAQLEALQASKRAACDRAAAAERELRERSAAQGSGAAAALATLQSQLHAAKEVRSSGLQGCSGSALMRTKPGRPVMHPYKPHYLAAPLAFGAGFHAA